MNGSSLVSVIIPVFNDAEQLQIALSSVQSQNIENLEIILVDDASKTPLLQSDYPNAIVHNHSKNLGAAAARNTGLSYASGKYIAFLDSDDRWDKGKLKIQVNILAEAPQEVAGVFTPFYYEDTPDKLYNSTLNPSDWFGHFLQGCRVAPGSTLLFRRTVLDEIGLQDEELRRFQDWDWLLRVAQKYSFTLASEARVILGSPSRPNSNLFNRSVQEIGDKWLPKLTKTQGAKLRATLQIERSAHAKQNGRFFLAIKHGIAAGLIHPKTLVANLLWKYLR